MSYISFFLNRTADKSKFDLIRITENDSGSFKVQSYEEQTKVNVNSPHKSLFLENQQKMLEYVDCLLNLIKKDEGIEAFVSVDFMLPGFPVVCTRVKDVDVSLILRCLQMMN